MGERRLGCVSYLCGVPGDVTCAPAGAQLQRRHAQLLLSGVRCETFKKVRDRSKVRDRLPVFAARTACSLVARLYCGLCCGLSCIVFVCVFALCLWYMRARFSSSALSRI